MNREQFGPRVAGLVTMAAAVALATFTARPALAAPRALTIDDAVQLALRTNPRLTAARDRERAGDEGVTSAGRRMLPAIRLSEELQRYNAPFALPFTFPSTMPNTPPVTTLFHVRDQTTNTFVASIDQPVLGLLRANHERETLIENSAADRSQIAVTENDLRANVETQFLHVFEAQAQEDIAAASVRDLSEQVTVAQARLASGVITRADLLRIQVAVANAEQQRLEAHSQGQTSRAQLFAAIGLGPADAAELTLVEPTARLSAARAATAPSAPSLAALLPRTQARRPELAQQAHLILAADRQVQARGYALLPDVDLEAAYLRLTGQPFSPVNSAYVGVKAQWAIWEWGASEHQRRAAIAQADAYRRDHDTLERQIEAELVASLAQGDAARGAVGSAATAVSSAEEAYRVTDAALKAGAATTTDLLESQAALTQARLNLIRAQYELVLSDVALAHATGG